MNKRRCEQLYIVGMLVLAALPLGAMTVHAQTEAIGNEAEVTLPAVRTADGGWNLNYFQELGDWFEAHYAFRSELISVNSWVQTNVLHSSSSDSVITGSDGWLYYAATLDDYQHNNNVSERTLFNEAHNIALYQEVVEESGADFLFTIAPNKNTLYGEHMPARDQVQVADESDFERLVPYLASEGVHYVDLKALFDATDAVLYYARDSHWTEEGALLVYNALLDAADVDHETYADVTPTEEDYYGDLANMLYPTPALVAPETRNVYLTDPNWEYTSETTSVEENFITTQNTTGSGTLLMYRDSFGNSLLPYMAEAFETGVFSKNEPLDGADLATYAPDVVIYEKVERHLPTLSSVPAMVTGPVRYASLEDMAGMEIAAETESGTTCEQTATNGYVTVSGVLAGEVVSDETRIYVAVTDAQDTTVYEAYTVTASGDVESDYGYLLYLDADAIEGEIQDLCVLAVNAGEDGADMLTAVYGTLEVPEPALEEEIVEEPEEDEAETEAEEPAEEAEETAVEDKAASETVEKPEKSAVESPQTTVQQTPVADKKTTTTEQKKTTTEQKTTSNKTTVTETPKKAETPAVTETPAATTPAAPAAPYEVSRVFVEDCGYDSGYWDITYSDGSHQYIDVP